MIVSYKCKCMPKEVDVMVPDRVPGTDLFQWMDCMRWCLWYDHKARSPKCRAKTVEYAKIPFDDVSGGIGEEPVRN